MIGRIVATAIVLILAFAAFWLGLTDAALMLDPVGIVLMLFVGIVLFLLAGIVWFNWDLVRDAFRQSRTPNLGVRSGPPIIRGMLISPQPHSRRSASPDQ